MAVQYIPPEFITYVKRSDIVWYVVRGDIDSNEICGVETPILYDPLKPKDIMVGVHDTNGNMKFKNVNQLEYNKQSEVDTAIYTDYFLAYVGDITSQLEVKLIPVSKVDNKLSIVNEQSNDFNMFKGVKGETGDAGIDGFEASNISISRTEYFTNIQKYMQLAKTITSFEERIHEATQKSFELSDTFEEIPIGTIVFSHTCPEPMDCWLEFGYSDVYYNNDDYPELSAIVKTWGSNYTPNDTQFCLGDSADYNRYLVIANEDMVVASTENSKLPNIDNGIIKSWEFYDYDLDYISYSTNQADDDNHSGWIKGYSTTVTTTSESFTTTPGLSSVSGSVFSEDVDQVYGNCIAINAWIKAKRIEDTSTTDEETDSLAYVLRITMATYPTNRSYYVGDTVNITGMVIQAIYSNGSRVTLTEDEFTYSPKVISSTADNYLVVTYGDFTCQCRLTITEVELIQLNITNYPNTINYEQGDYPDFTGMVVMGTYNNGDVKEITDYTWDPEYVKTVPLEYITITKDGYSDGFYVNVSETEDVELTLECNSYNIYVGVDEEAQLVITLPTNLSTYTEDEIASMFYIVTEDEELYYTYDEDNYYSVDYSNNTITFTFTGADTGTNSLYVSFIYEVNEFKSIIGTATIVLNVGLEMYVKYTLTPYVALQDANGDISSMVLYNNSALTGQNPSPLTLSSDYVQQMAESANSRTINSVQYWYIDTPNYIVSYTLNGVSYSTTFSRIYFLREIDYADTSLTEEHNSASLSVGNNTTISGYVYKPTMDDVYGNTYEYVQYTATLAYDITCTGTTYPSFYYIILSSQYKFPTLSKSLTYDEIKDYVTSGVTSVTLSNPIHDDLSITSGTCILNITYNTENTNSSPCYNAITATSYSYDSYTGSLFTYSFNVTASSTITGYCPKPS